MKLYLFPETLIKEVKKAFTKEFPYLKVEFLQKPPSLKVNSFKKEVVPDSATLLEATGATKEGEIEIRPQQTIAEIEQLFQNKYYVTVRVFRKTRHSWIEASRTADFTFQEQNTMGREACEELYGPMIL